MHRRVLIAEQTDTVRAVAEAVLRQNGFDVIAVTAAEKAREVLELSKPDLIIIGADLAAADGTPFYERLRQDSRMVQIPTILIERADKSPVTVSDLTVIPRPFDPQDLLQKVTLALAVGSKTASSGSSLLSGTEVDDDFLDAALGLDDIDVTASEVMNKTGQGMKVPATGAGEKMIGIESHHDNKSADTGGTKVEAMVLDMNSSRITSRKPGRKAPVEGSGGLEILADQYGMEQPLQPVQNEQGDHDYNWFVDAIRKDNDPTAQNIAHDTGNLVISERSAAVDPSTPGPPTSHRHTPPPAGVEKFIDEFKKEMQQLREVESDTAIPEVKTIKAEAPGEKLDWEEKLEHIGPTELETFTREFAKELGSRVAEIIAAKIDPDKLMRLIRAEVVARYQKKK